MVLFYKNNHTCQRVKHVENIEDIKVNLRNYMDNFEIHEGQRLPEDLTEDKIFLLKNDDLKTVASQVACGRKYGKLRNTIDKKLQKIFHGQHAIVKTSQCQGNYKCVNKDCPFKARFNLMNQVFLICFMEYSPIFTEILF